MYYYVRIIKQARAEGKDAYIADDKLYIKNKTLYKPGTTVEKSPGSTSTANTTWGIYESDLKVSWNLEGLTEAGKSYGDFV